MSHRRRQFFFCNVIHLYFINIFNIYKITLKYKMEDKLQIYIYTLIIDITLVTILFTQKLSIFDKIYIYTLLCISVLILIQILWIINKRCILNNISYIEHGYGESVSFLTILITFIYFIKLIKIHNLNHTSIG